MAPVSRARNYSGEGITFVGLRGLVGGAREGRWRSAGEAGHCLHRVRLKGLVSIIREGEGFEERITVWEGTEEEVSSGVAAEKHKVSLFIRISVQNNDAVVSYVRVNLNRCFVMGLFH